MNRTEEQKMILLSAMLVADVEFRKREWYESDETALTEASFDASLFPAFIERQDKAFIENYAIWRPIMALHHDIQIELFKVYKQFSKTTK